eukprot:639626-Amphidinium_carterae.1
MDILCRERILRQRREVMDIANAIADGKDLTAFKETVRPCTAVDSNLQEEGHMLLDGGAW